MRKQREKSARQLVTRQTSNSMVNTDSYADEGGSIARRAHLLRVRGRLLKRMLFLKPAVDVKAEKAGYTALKWHRERHALLTSATCQRLMVPGWHRLARHLACAQLGRKSLPTNCRPQSCFRSDNLMPTSPIALRSKRMRKTALFRGVR